MLGSKVVVQVGLVVEGQPTALHAPIHLAIVVIDVVVIAVAVVCISFNLINGIAFRASLDVQIGVVGNIFFVDDVVAAAADDSVVAAADIIVVDSSDAVVVTDTVAADGVVDDSIVAVTDNVTVVYGVVAVVIGVVAVVLYAVDDVVASVVAVAEAIVTVGVDDCVNVDAVCNLSGFPFGFGLLFNLSLSMVILCNLALG